MQKKITRRALLLGKKFTDEESGATAIEYGLIAGLIAIAITASVTRIGEGNTQTFKCAKRALRGKKQTKKCK